MSLLAVCSVKGRPGVTTTALGLAAVLPQQARAVVVECDPAGGDLAARHRLTLSPGLVGLATATRTSTQPSSGDLPGGRRVALSRFVQHVRLGEAVVPVVVAPAGGAQTRVALSILARPDQATLVPADRVVIADLGRLDASSPAFPLVAMADLVLVLTRGRLDEITHLREHMGELQRAAGNRLTVVLGTDGVYTTREVAEVLPVDGAEVTVWGLLPDDDRAARILGGELVAGRKWRRLPLMLALDLLDTHLWPRLHNEVSPSEDDLQANIPLAVP
jgi:hypothetical protein